MNLLGMRRRRGRFASCGLTLRRVALKDDRQTNQSKRKTKRVPRSRQVISLQAQKHELIREAFRSPKRVAGFQSSTALYSVACEEGSFQPTSKAAFYSLRSLPGCPSKTQHQYLAS